MPKVLDVDEHTSSTKGTHTLFDGRLAVINAMLVVAYRQEVNLNALKMNGIDRLLWKMENLKDKNLVWQVEQFVLEKITNGEVRYGGRLPSIRALADLNNLDMNVIKVAYNKLSDLGWVTATLGSGTFVCRDIGEEGGLIGGSSFVQQLPLKISSNIHSFYTPPPVQDFTIIGMDMLSPFYYPGQVMVQYMEQHRKRYKDITQLEQAKDERGLAYREAVRYYFNSARKLRLNSDCMFVILSRSESIRAVFNALFLRPGDIVINTASQDLILDHTLNELGVEVYTLDVLDPDFINKLVDLLKVVKIRVLYLRPQCAFPAAKVLNEQACQVVIELAKKNSFFIIEDDHYHEFWFRMKPFKPLANYDHDGHVIYLALLSQTGPYMCNTWLIAAAAEFIDLLRSIPVKACEFRDLIKEAAIIDMINNNDLLPFVKKVRIAKEMDRDRLFWELDNYLGNNIEINKPDSGLAFWLEFPQHLKIDDAIEYLKEKDIEVPDSPTVYPKNRSVYNLRLGFGTYNDSEAGHAAKSLGDIFENLKSDSK